MPASVCYGLRLERRVIEASPQYIDKIILSIDHIKGKTHRPVILPTVFRGGVIGLQNVGGRSANRRVVKSRHPLPLDHVAARRSGVLLILSGENLRPELGA